jgi:hypothetical protein
VHGWGRFWREILRWIWCLVRLPVVTLLVILEPVVSLVFDGLALLGVLVTLFYNLIRPEFANLIAAAALARAVDQRFFGILAARAATPAALAQDASSSAGSRADAPMSEVSPRANWACPALRIFVAATRSALAS